MLARAPQLVLRLRMSEDVRALDHALHCVERRVIQRDDALARLVLTCANVDEAFRGIEVFPTYVLHFDAAP
jgi:hypothetical protein